MGWGSIIGTIGGGIIGGLHGGGQGAGMGAGIGGMIGTGIDNVDPNSAAKHAAQDQMNFQQYNANTQWQRGVKDMTAAGINPMLAVNQGGAASPSGSQANTMSDVDVTAKRATTAMDATRMFNDIRMTEAQIGKTKADTLTSAANAHLANEQAKATGVTARKTAEDAKVSKGLGDTVLKLTDGSVSNAINEAVSSTAKDLKQRGSIVRGQRKNMPSNPNKPKGGFKPPGDDDGY